LKTKSREKVYTHFVYEKKNMTRHHTGQDAHSPTLKAQPMPTTYCAVVYAQGKQVARIHGREVAELEAQANRFIRRCRYADATYVVTAS
jgi:hypothetical protein